MLGLKLIFKVYISDYRNNMDKEALVARIIFIVYMSCTRNPLLPTSSNNKLTFI